MSKVSIIGAGEVGASCATCLADRDFANEIVIVDVKPGLAEAEEVDYMRFQKGYVEVLKTLGCLFIKFLIQKLYR